MAKKALIVKQQRTPKFKVRGYTRCTRCGRPRAVYRRFELVPDLLPHHGAPRRAARYHQVQLVINETSTPQVLNCRKKRRETTVRKACWP